jgi:hypothetical protein
LVASHRVGPVGRLMRENRIASGDSLQRYVSMSEIAELASFRTAAASSADAVLDSASNMEQGLLSQDTISDRHHYVLVVHGTFSGPKESQGGWMEKWWAPNVAGSFCEKLKAVLDKTHQEGLGPVRGEAVWGNLETQSSEPFFWGGQNTDASREAGAMKLASRIMDIRQQDPQALFHLIAHSHGGNVVLRAVEIILGELGEEGAQKLVPPAPRSGIFRWLIRCGSKRPAQPLESQMSDIPAALFMRNFGQQLVQQGALYKTRQRMDFVRVRYPSIPMANPLGRLVFLGTPFLYKAETKMLLRLGEGWWLWVLVLLLLVLGIQSSILSPRSHMALLAAFVIFGIVFVLVLVIDLSEGNPDPFKTFRSSPHSSGNIYHLTKQSWSANMSAFVIHSGLLDEANFALKAVAPLVKTYVVPEMDRFEGTAPWEGVARTIRRALRTAENHAIAHFRVASGAGNYGIQPSLKRVQNQKTTLLVIYLLVFRTIIVVAKLVVAVPFLIVHLLSWPFKVVAISFLKRKLQQLLTQLVLGTGSAERPVRGAKLTVCEFLKLEQLSELTSSGTGQAVQELPAVCHWNVRDLLLQEEASESGNSTRVRGWSDFSRHPDSSGPVYTALEKAGCFKGLAPGGPESTELKRIAGVLEERLKEVSGQVKVRHSLYHQKREIIEKVAEFLQAGPLGLSARQSHVNPRPVSWALGV